MPPRLKQGLTTIYLQQQYMVPDTKKTPSPSSREHVLIRLRKSGRAVYCTGLLIRAGLSFQVVPPQVRIPSYAPRHWPHFGGANCPLTHWIQSENCKNDPSSINFLGAKSGDYLSKGTVDSFYSLAVQNESALHRYPRIPGRDQF